MLTECTLSKFEEMHEKSMKNEEFLVKTLFIKTIIIIIEYGSLSHG